MSSFYARLNSVIDFAPWKRYWGKTDFKVQPEKLPQALRDFTGRVQVHSLRNIQCPVLRNLLGLLPIGDQKRFDNLFANDKYPNCVQNRYPVAKEVVEQNRHPLVEFYGNNAYEFLAAFQTAWTYVTPFLTHFHEASQRIRRSEASKRRKTNKRLKEQSAPSSAGSGPGPIRTTRRAPARISIASKPAHFRSTPRLALEPIPNTPLPEQPAHSPKPTALPKTSDKAASPPASSVATPEYPYPLLKLDSPPPTPGAHLDLDCHNEEILDFGDIIIASPRD